MSDVKRRKVRDYNPDPANANEGTERGLRALDDSMSALGTGRSIVVDKNDYVSAGNKTLERAADLGILEVIEITTKGDALIVHKREDWDLLDSDPNNPARRYAYADNRVGQLDLSWNPEQLLADLNAGMDMSKMFSQDELGELLAGLRDDAQGGDGERSDGSLLGLTDVTINDPTHIVIPGEVWLLGEHKLICADVLTEWSLWARHLSGDVLFVPFPGPFAPLTKKAEGIALVMVQPDPYIAGHILDRYVEIHGEDGVRKDD